MASQNRRRKAKIKSAAQIGREGGLVKVPRPEPWPDPPDEQSASVADEKPRAAERKRKTVTFSLTPEAVERLKASSEHHKVPMSYILEDLIVNELADRRAVDATV